MTPDEQAQRVLCEVLAMAGYPVAMRERDAVCVWCVQWSGFMGPAVWPTAGAGAGTVEVPTVDRRGRFAWVSGGAGTLDQAVASVLGRSGPGDVVHALWTRRTMYDRGCQPGSLAYIERELARVLWGVQVDWVWRRGASGPLDHITVTRPPDVDWDEADVQAIVDEHRPVGAVVPLRVVSTTLEAGPPPWAGLVRKPKAPVGP